MTTQFPRGLLFPLTRSGKGDFVNAGGLPKFRNNVLLILGTRAETERRPGEIPWRPDFGGQIHQLLHAAIDPNTLALARFFTVEALQRWEPRARVVQADLRSETGLSGSAVEIAVAVDVRGLEPGLAAPSGMTISL